MVKVKNALMRALQIITVIIFILLTLLVVYQVVTRYILNNPSAWTEEALTYGFTWLVLLGSALVFGKREQMALTIFSDRLQARSKYMTLVPEILNIIFALLVMVLGGIQIVRLTWNQVTPVMQLSTGLMYTALPISGILTVFFCIVNIYQIINSEEWVNEEDTGDNI